MRYVTYRSGGESRLGSLQNGYIVDVGQVAGISRLFFLIEGGPEVWKDVAATLQASNVEELAAKGWAVPYQEGLLTAPITKPPKNVICLGRNYYKHFLEGAVARGSDEKPPAAPIYFTKPHTSIIGPFDPIPLDPEVTQKLDWEAELGMIIGVGGRKIKKEDAARHVFGYTVINDVTARDLQDRHLQWFKGKGLDASCPMGPVVVTPDELPDPVHLPISLKVNGVVKQDANTGQLMFDIPTMIEDLSLAITLEPGDVISTGTPDGVGHFSKPPEYLKVGDVMETIIEGVGTIRNRITTPERAEIITQYNRERDMLLAVLHHLEAEHYGLDTACEGWSVKDLVGHLTAGTNNVIPFVQQHIDKEFKPGVEALNERNALAVEKRKEQSLSSLINEIVETHHKNIEFYLALTDEQLEVEHANAMGAVMTAKERFRRFTTHYREHAAQIATAIGVPLQ